MLINGVEVVVNGIQIPKEEIMQYVRRGKAMYANLDRVTLKVPYEAPDEVEIEYHVKNKGFERIRRITGYLVGDMSHWNDGKRAEERDRVKHGV